MIRPEDIPDSEHAPRPLAYLLLETHFDCAIRDARDTGQWPAIVRWPTWPPSVTASDAHTAMWRIAQSYRDVGWRVVTYESDPAVFATITRR